MKKFLFSDAVLAWFEHHGRKNLPWQHPISAYRVYISEIMLQQTQVATVIPYFQRFMEKFPSIDALSQAPLDHVLHLWTGLGYYARARNLHKTAKIIVEKYKSVFPTTRSKLETLPGVGRSTAAAICALAFNQPEAILDGNVKRVLARFHGVSGTPGKKTESILWPLAYSHLPKIKMREYTQAMMDLGATLCVRSDPQCGCCPLKENCVGYQSGEPTRYPGAKPTKKMPVREVKLLVLVDEDKHILLQKRPALGIWGGLWSLPEFQVSDFSDICFQKFNCVFKKKKKLTSFRHTFTHFHLDIFPIQFHVIRNKMCVMEDENFIWYNPLRPVSIGLPKPICKILSWVK